MTAQRQTRLPGATAPGAAAVFTCGLSGYRKVFGQQGKGAAMVSGKSRRADLGRGWPPTAPARYAAGVVLALTGARLNPGTNVLALLAAVVLAVSFLGFRAMRRIRRAARTSAETAERVAEADRMRAGLLATLGHDLRAPLAAAKAAVSGLRSTDVFLTSDDRGELLAAADESLERVARLVAGLLDMSRLEAGKLAVFPRPVVLGDAIERAVDDVGPQSVTVRVPAGLPEVMADPELMERVIVNLTRNAVRYSPPGIPPVLTACSNGGRVELRVIDNGPGIPDSDRERAFLPFQRLGDTSGSPGVGLGLALSRGLTEAMGGTLAPHETPGGGLTMVISLPGAGPTARADGREPIGTKLSGMSWPHTGDRKSSAFSS